MKTQKSIKKARFNAVIWMAVSLAPLLAACQLDVGGGDDTGSAQDEAKGGTKACGGRGGLACSSGFFCDYDLDAACGVADQAGVCRPIPEVCTEDYTPVCGCDGVTYSNACTANAAGVSVAASGECAPPPGDDCGGLLGLGCAEGMFCDYPIEAMCGAADQTGTCRPIPEVCTEDYTPVCGCDDVTYSNACTANAAGVSVAASGECAPAPPGEDCGGLLGLACPEGMFCEYPIEAMCGAADQTGTCRFIPENVACSAEYDPVCGCDGVTYSNACSAYVAGMSVAALGECP